MKYSFISSCRDVVVVVVVADLCLEKRKRTYSYLISRYMTKHVSRVAKMDLVPTNQFN